MNVPWILFIVILQVRISLANPCHGGSNCASCISRSPECAWCADFNYHATNLERCDWPKQLKLDGCTNVINPSSELYYVKNEPVRNGDSQRDAIQLRPQSIRIRLRPSEVKTFQLTFRLAENYPVDLYYLMDLSSSMSDDKNNIENMALSIGSSMADITQNFRLGFGSFVEKVIAPFIAVWSSSGQPAVNKHSDLIAPYSFKHQLALSADADLFKTSVGEAKLAANADNPESGLDALMQAIVCKDQIGWREGSRKIVLFATDNTFKMAGDGRLAGIFKANDGKCHLDSNGYYSEAVNQDYPSVGKIADTVLENNINCIFAVVNHVYDVYSALSRLIPGSVTTILAEGSTNIVELIQQNYKTITSRLELNTDAADDVLVNFKSSCLNSGMKETRVCEGLKIGDSVTFNVSVSVPNCPTEANKRRRAFTIYPVGLSEKLLITLDLICECDCQSEKEELPFDKCQGNSTLECGQCLCEAGRFGPLCECEGSSRLSSNCTDPSIPGQQVCSGRGRCMCGSCQCFSIGLKLNKRYTGQYCECDDTTCSLGTNNTCNGNGQCECGICQCAPGFSGSLCDCPTTQDACMASSGKVCNGEGACVCGGCRCFLNSSYVGQTCEECPTCPGKCGEHRACVLCKAFSSGPLKTPECAASCPNITLLDSLDKMNKNDKKLLFCEGTDNENCIYFYSYRYNENRTVELTVQRNKVCPEPVQVVTVVLGVVGGILAIGILILIIAKIAIFIMDRIEYSKFEKEAKNVAWAQNENPLYDPAETHFENPMFRN